MPACSTCNEHWVACKFVKIIWFAGRVIAVKGIVRKENVGTAVEIVIAAAEVIKNVIVIVCAIG